MWLYDVRLLSLILIESRGEKALFEARVLVTGITSRTEALSRVFWAGARHDQPRRAPN